MKTVLSLLMIFSSFTFAQNIANPVKVKTPVVFDESPALRDMSGIPPGKIDRSWKKLIPNKIGFDRNSNRITDKSLQKIDYSGIQTNMGSNATSVSEIANFDGMPNIDGYLPPDTQGDVGLNHYVQVVNSSFQIWNKSGSSVYGPFALGTIWQGFPGPWDTSLNDGDPIVLYDQAADRWLISEFSLPNYPNGPFYELIAISTTSDPTGSWYRYAFEYENMPDYPKLGVWSDGYYMATNNFFRSAFFVGAGASCFERDSMLVGSPNARLVYINVSDVPNGNEAGSMLPSDWDGITSPPAGSPNYFTYFNDGSTDNLRLWEFDVDWNTPLNSTFTLATTLNTNSFDSNTGSIPQPGTSQGLDALSDRLMYRFQYRNFGTYEAMVTSHAVDAGTSTGVKWYEMRNTGSGWTMHQEGTYAPDSDHRWMSSIAMNKNGDIGLEYTVSSSSTYPSIRYTGRYKDDPLGQMTITEGTIIAGGRAQTHSSGRWGDYSMMSVDPTDDITFWITNEYMNSTGTGSGDWSTRIGAVSFGSTSILADITVIIEGAFDGSTGMDTDINGSIPLTSPYSEDPRPVSSIPSDIVDWVLVELRTTSDGPAIVSKSAFLRNDGKIVDDDGTSDLSLGVSSGDYFIVVKHRNHLTIMSKNPVAFNNASVTAYDFTTGSDKYYGTGGAVQLN